MDPASQKALKRMAAAQGDAWSEAEVERLLAAAERSLALIEQLDALELRQVEPAIHYRMPGGRP